MQPVVQWWYPGYGVPGHGALPGVPPWYGSGYTSRRVPNSKIGKNKGNSGKSEN